MLYAIAILPVLGNDEFHGTEVYQILSLLILAVGAWLYLVVPQRWQQLLALVVPAVLSPAVMSLGLYLLFPSQDWAEGVASFQSLGGAPAGALSGASAGLAVPGGAGAAPAVG